jgi:membrane protease YdiL (CAAX protease family)
MSILVRRLVIFFGLAYAFTWYGNLGNALWPSEWWMAPMNPLGPLVAAPIAILINDGTAGLKAWLRRLANFRAPLWVYGAAILVPLAIIVTAIAGAAATGAMLMPLPEVSIVEMLIMIPILAIMGPATEEPAFRGYGLHELQRAVSPLAASLVIGLGVVVWHAPLILTGDLPWPWIMTIVFVSVVYTWLYNAGGSVWPLVVLHLTVNYFGSEFLGAVVSDPSTQLIYALIYAGLYLGWAAILVWKFGPSLSGRGRTRGEPAPRGLNSIGA